MISFLTPPTRKYTRSQNILPIDVKVTGSMFTSAGMNAHTRNRTPARCINLQTSIKQILRNLQFFKSNMSTRLHDGELGSDLFFLFFSLFFLIFLFFEILRCFFLFFLFSIFFLFFPFLRFWDVFFLFSFYEILICFSFFSLLCFYEVWQMMISFIASLN